MPTPETLPTILGLSTAFPELRIPQTVIFRDFFADLYADVPHAEDLFASTRVEHRHFSWDPREAFSEGSPPTSTRMQVWNRVVQELGMRALPPLLADHDTERVGSFVMASCTGYAGPTPEMLLARSLGLRQDLRRTLIGHMGCYAAFNALKVAVDAVVARPAELALVNCTELCLLHIRPEATKEQAVIHALFGDACATALIGAAEPGAGPQILQTHTETYYDSHEAMTWHVLDDGFRMTLSPYIPLILGRVIEPFVERMLAKQGLTIADIQHWGIHPGGPRIVEAIAARLGLSEAQQRATWSTLAEHGNCSSSTILLVLDDMIRHDKPAPGEYGVFMAFGPGLTAEGMLIRF